MTTREILKQTGLTDEQIDALDKNVLGGFDKVLTTATAEREAAELASRAQTELYSNKIAPALDAWGIEKTTLEAERDFYRTQALGAKSAGFIPKEAPGFTPPQDPATGKFVANANTVPGSPSFSPDQILEGISNATWFTQEHLRLHGQPAPDDFMSLNKEAVAQHMNFRDYVEKKYRFVEKRSEIAATAQKAHDDKIRAEATADNDRKWAERVGNNPMVRQGSDSQYAKVKEAVTAGKRQDPLKMTAEERRAQTRQNIQSELVDNAASTVN